MKKWIISVIGVLIIGFAGYQWYQSKTEATQVIPQIRTGEVQKGELAVKISGSGTVQPITSEDIMSKVNNNEIDEVLVSVGDEVKKGDKLITFTNGSDPIVATEDGMITSLSIASGERVTVGQVVAHITNYKDLQTVVQIDELDIPKVKLNQKATIKVNAFPDKTYSGKVTDIANEGTSTNGVSTFDVTINFEKPKNLKVGMSTEASILTAKKKDALYVPIDAVHTNNGQKYVIVKTDNQAEQRTVKTGLANEDYVEITKGLREGEIIQLPQLAANLNSANKSQMMQGGFGAGGMNRNGGGFRQFGGRGEN